LVYRQADPDHNRLDTTVLGDRDAVARAALSGARVAVALIDMEHHSGGHPRMGAADVIPFMPVRGVTMDDCVELARSFAKELATSLGLPVYLYDRAALVPERASLAEVRRGEFEGLRDAVDAVAREAAAGGLRITDSEIVGLVPEAALGKGDTAHVRLRGFDADRQILERQIEGAG